MQELQLQWPALINSLVENVVGRARGLAGSLMFALSEKVGITFCSNST